MLSYCNNFKVFGSGDGRMILIADNVGYVVNQPVLKEVSVTCGAYPGGLLSSELNFVAGEIEQISGKGLKQLYDPVMQKSILDLMKAVNRKLNNRE